MRLDKGDEYLVYVGDAIERVILSAWFWLPVVFAAYWIGRRKFSLRAFLLAATLEAVALGLLARYILQHPVTGA